jgi:hypothetical protein
MSDNNHENTKGFVEEEAKCGKSSPYAETRDEVCTTIRSKRNMLRKLQKP